MATNISLPSALAEGSIMTKYHGFSQKRYSAKAIVIVILSEANGNEL